MFFVSMLNARETKEDVIGQHNYVIIRYWSCLFFKGINTMMNFLGRKNFRILSDRAG